jgi:putative PIN family toxin of toxin-antitoxin system
LRGVLDPKVLISAMLSRGGAPARVLQVWIDGGFELLISPLLTAELERALAYPKLRKRIAADDGQRFLEWLGRAATLVDDPDGPPPVSSRDPGDDYLIALAAAQRAVLVSGDSDLLTIDAAGLPIYAASDFLSVVDQRE